jgi:MFS transporter, DHA2 family, multidrug resistance protein
VLHLAVPRLTVDLKSSSVQLLWVIEIHGFLLAGSLITMDTFGDRVGRRRLLLIPSGWAKIKGQEALRPMANCSNC